MFNLMPKDTKFYDELERLADRVVNSATQFEAMATNFPNSDGQMQAIEGDRKSAGRTLTESLVRLDHAFITPLDREDILNLLSEMYGVVDRVAELSQRFRLYNLTDLHPTLTRQARNLSTIAKALSEGIHGLRQEKKLKDMTPTLEAVAGAMELVMRDSETFLGTLFAGHPDPLDVIKKKELYDLLEDAIERCEEATEVLARVLLKNG